MVVAVLVQVVATVKKLFNLVYFLFRVADLVINNSSAPHNAVVIESVVSNVRFLCITAQVIKLVYVYAVS